jgi:hypothetical protein
MELSTPERIEHALHAVADLGEALDIPLTTRPLDHVPGSATGRIGACPDRTFSGKWNAACFRTHHAGQSTPGPVPAADPTGLGGTSQGRCGYTRTEFGTTFGPEELWALARIFVR